MWAYSTVYSLLSHVYTACYHKAYWLTLLPLHVADANLKNGHINLYVRAINVKEENTQNVKP